MNVRTLKIPQGKPLYIVTPVGLITLTRGVGDGRSFHVEMPDSCEAVKDLSRVGDRSGLPVLVIDNKLVPAYHMLVPVVNDSTGELINAVIPKALRITIEEELKDEQHKPISNVADDESGDGVGHAPDRLQTRGSDTGGEGEDDGRSSRHRDHAESVRH